MATTALVSFSIPTAAESFTGLGYAAPGATSGLARGISADGTVVVGESGDQAFRWTQSGGIVGLGFFPGNVQSIAYATSADGSVVVGSGNGGGAFRWTQATGLVALGGAASIATAVSADGSIVVGSGPGGAGDQAFRWTQATGTVPMGFLPGGNQSVANGISADGSIIVGQSTYGGTNFQAFRWTQAGGMVGLGFIPGGSVSQANAISADGSVIVGNAQNAGGEIQIFRWTQATGMVDLGRPGTAGGIVTAAATNTNGSIIVGHGGGLGAWRWSQAGGFQSIQALLTERGVNLTGWTLNLATGVSGNGQIIVGGGSHPSGFTEPWLARFSDTIGFGIITPSIVYQSFASLQGFVESSHGAVNGGLGTLTEIAAHHGCAAVCVAAYGLYSAERGPSFDDPGYVGTVGLAKRLLRDLSVGVTLSVGSHHNDLNNGSTDKSQTFGGGVYTAYTPNEGPQLLAGALLSRMNDTVERGYSNGSTPVTSTGSTKGTGNGAVVRLGWAAQPFESLRVIPFADYEITRVRYSSYTETTGPFPAFVDAIDDTQQRTRVGAEMRYRINPATYVWGTLAWGHRITGTTAPISGQLVDLFAVSVSASPVTRDWTEASVGLRYALNDNTFISTSLGARLGGGSSTITNVRSGVSAKF